MLKVTPGVHCNCTPPVKALDTVLVDARAGHRRQRQRQAARAGQQHQGASMPGHRT